MKDHGPRSESLEAKIESFRCHFGELVAFHRLIERAAEREFDDAVAEAGDWMDPSENGLGDVYREAEKALGTGPHQIAQHAGLMVLVRAISLAEATLARIAATFFTDAEGIVFTNGKAWDRRSAAEFFRAVLVRPFDIDSLGMGSIVQLRDVYAHGYGTFADWESARVLEERLLAAASDAPATPEELAAGYTDEHYILGPRAGSSDYAMLGANRLAPSAYVSRLATFRLLNVIRATVEGAWRAAEWGLKKDGDLAASKFVRNWMRKNGQSDAGSPELDYVGRVQIQFSGKRVLLLDSNLDGEPASLTWLMVLRTLPSR